MRKGFTLIELSIVLVIIGLLIGGILVGQSLIESAKINKQIREWAQIEAAVNNYKTKYKYLPGDDPKMIVTGGHYGNGDGYINPTYGAYLNTESCAFFSLLSSVENVFPSFSTPCLVNAANKYEFNVDLPDLMDRKDAYYYIVSQCSDYAGSCGIAAGEGNYFVTHTGANGATLGASVVDSNSAVLTPTDALTFDSKLDDGKPTTGTITARGFMGKPVDNTTAVNCINSSLEYKTSYTRNSCSLFIKAKFY